MSADKYAAAPPKLRLVPDDVAHTSAMSNDMQVGFLRSVLDSSPDCIKIVELDGSLSFMNTNGCNAMEVDDFKMINGNMWADLWPESSQPQIRESVAAARNNEKMRFEAFCPTAKGTPRWWDVSVGPVRGPEGQPIAIVSISRDITDRIHRENRIRLHELELQNLAMHQADELKSRDSALANQSIRMREIDHRMKNSLAMLTALLRSESRATENHEAAEKIASAAGRVASIASVHEHLYLDADNNDATGGRQLRMQSYLASLCNDLQNTLGRTDVKVQLSCDDITMSDDAAVTLGLVVSELVMNAMRHFGSDGECTIRVNLTEAFPGGKKTLTVSDNGCGLPDDFQPRSSKGLGMRVVTTGADRLGGTLTFGRDGDNANGASFSVTF